LVRDDAAVRLLHRLDERLLVERLQRARVDDLDGDALRLLRVLRRVHTTSPTRPPCPSAFFAAASDSCTRRPVAITVTSEPSRCTRALPISIGSSSSVSSSLMQCSVRCSKKTTGLSS